MEEKWMRWDSLASDPGDMRKEIKKAYFHLWKFKLAKQELMHLLILLRPRTRDSANDEMKAALKIISIKTDLSDVLSDWDRHSHVLQQEFANGVAVVDEYLEEMQFPFQEGRFGAHTEDDEKLSLVYNPGLKGFEFHVEDEVRTAHEDDGSVSWQTAYEEEQ